MGAGLQRAARAARRSNYPGTPEPAVGQWWEDCDKREKKKREVRIGAVDSTHATCAVFINGVDRKRTTRIKLDRFLPTSHGYRYLRTDAASKP